ncbi:MAG: extracellular solute-binding protein [Alphaproteobacteria bacterium]|nr:extracellular solute-binding protein [Alphaproteobacteria bacterium]
MKKMLSVFILMTLALIAYCYYPFYQTPEIRFRYSLRGDLGQALEEIVNDFNRDHPQYKVVLEYGGSYTDSFVKTCQEKRSQRPQLLMVAEFNTVTLKKQEKDYIPLCHLIDINTSDFVPVVKESCTFRDKDGKKILHSLPFNCSTAILYYNRDIFKKVGLPDRAPETWEEMEQYAKKLKDSGYTAFTTTWPAAYLLEHFSVTHDIPYATQKNGYEGDNPKLLLNTKPFVEQLEHFADWQKKGFYIYGTRNVETAEDKFIKQECAMLLQGQHRLVFLKDKGGFDVGVGTYPYWKKLTPKGPYALNIGGTSIWALREQPSLEGTKAFLTYLASEKIQTFWHKRTGYLPITLPAYEKTKTSSFYGTNPAAYMAVKQVIERQNQNLPNGIHIQNYANLRDKVMDAIEDVLLKDKPAQETLDKLVADQSH